MNLASRVPAITPTRVAAIKAQDAAKKIVSGDLDVAEKDKTPSWVLSPSSAMKIEPKVIQNSFQSISVPRGEGPYRINSGRPVRDNPKCNAVRATLCVLGRSGSRIRPREQYCAVRSS